MWRPSSICASLMTQRRCEPYDVTLRRLRQQPQVPHLQTHVHRSLPLLRPYHHRIQQPLAPHRRDHAPTLLLDLGQPGPEHLPLLRRPLVQLLVDQHPHRRLAHRACQRVAAVGAPVLARLDGEHHLVAGQHRRHRQHSTRQRLAEDEHVGLDAVVVAAEHAAGAAEAGLHLVGDEEGAVLATEGLGTGEVAGLGDDDAGLALDGLHHEGGDGGVLQGGLEGAEVVVGDEVEVGEKGAEVGRGRLVGGRGDGGQSAAPEVAGSEDHSRLVGRDALHLVRPLARQLDGRLATLHSRLQTKDGGRMEVSEWEAEEQGQLCQMQCAC